MGTRPSPPSSPRTKQGGGGGWNQPSSCPLFAGVCLLLLLPQTAGSEGAGELRVPGSGSRALSGVARGCGPARRNALRWSPWALAGGWSYKGAKVGAAAWRTAFIPTAHLLRLTHFSLGKGLLGSDGDVLHKVRRRKPPPIHTHNPGASSPPSKPNSGSRSGGCSLSPTEERRSPGCSAEFGVRERPSDCQRDRERLRE